MWGYYTNSPAMWVWMVLQGVFWLALGALAVWALVRWLNRPSRYPTSTPSSAPPNAPQQASSSALDILQQRYARGEIDAATFEDMRARLQASAPTPDLPPAQPTQTREPVSSGH